MKIKVAIAGYGKMGKIRERTVANNPHTNLALVYDPSFKAGAEKNSYHCGSYNEILESDCDAVFFAGYAKYSAEYVARALDAGKHVFCEKPPANNLQELVVVENSLKSSGKVLKYGFNHRYHHSVIKAKQLLDSGALGKVLSMRGVYGKAGSIDFESNWRNYKEYAGGGILMDQGIHMLDLFRFLGGEDFHCKGALVKTLNWDIEWEDNVMALFESADGAVYSLHSSATQWKHKFMLEIFAQKGYLILDGILSNSMSYAPEKLVFGLRKDENDSISMGRPAETVFSYDVDDSWAFELDEFVSAILQKVPIKNGTLEDARQVMAVLDQIYSYRSS